MCFQADAAQQPTADYGQALRAQIKYAPDIYAQNAEFSPQYTQLGLSDMDEFLNGTNGTPGFLSEYANQIMPALTAAQTTANTATRTANINDAQNLSGAYTTAERSANPQAASLLDQLSQTAGQQLSYGTQLTPAEQLQTNQSLRQGQAARGMGFGPGDVFNESLADTDMGQQLLSSREGQAGTAANELQSFYGNPVAAISGMGSNAGMSSGGVASMGSGAGSSALSTTGSEFNPMALTSLINSANVSNVQGQNQMTEAAASGFENMGSSTL